VAEGDEIGDDVGGLFAEAVLNELERLAVADEGVGLLPVDLVVGDLGVVDRVEEQVLLDEDDEAVLDLATAQVGGACKGREGLAAVARKDGEDALGELATQDKTRPDKTRQTYRGQFAIDVFDKVGAELCKDLERVGCASVERAQSREQSAERLTGVSRWR
jgi:hypothetical protein